MKMGKGKGKGREREIHYCMKLFNYQYYFKANLLGWGMRAAFIKEVKRNLQSFPHFGS